MFPPELVASKQYISEVYENGKLTSGESPYGTPPYIVKNTCLRSR